jgi:WD40 repeat protein
MVGPPALAAGLLKRVATIDVDPAGVLGAVDGLAFSGSGYLLAASDNAGVARVYDLSDPVHPALKPWSFRHGSMAAKQRHTSAAEMNAVAFSPDGRWLAGGMDSRGLRVWRVADGGEALHLDNGTNCDGAAFSPDGRWLASAADNRIVVRPFDTASGTAGDPVLDEAIADSGEVNSLSWSGDSRTLAAAGLKVVAVFARDQVALRERMRVPNEGRSGSVKSVRISPDGSLVAIGARDERARVFDLATGRIVVDLPHQGNRQYLPGDDDDKNVAVEAVAWSEDGRHLFTSGLIDGVLRVWRRDDWSLVDWTQAQAPLRAIEFIDVRGDMVAVGGDEGVVNVYRFREPEALQRIGPSAPGGPLVFEAENPDASVRQGVEEWRPGNGDGADGSSLVARCAPWTAGEGGLFDPTRAPPKLDYRLTGAPAGSIGVAARVRGRGELRVALGAAAAKPDELATLRSESTDRWRWVTTGLSSPGGDATLQVWPGPGEWIEVDRFVLVSTGAADRVVAGDDRGPTATPRRPLFPQLEQPDGP